MRKMGTITLFLCGDVMLGRGIDQILPCPGDPVLHELYMNNARGYVKLAERVHGHSCHHVKGIEVYKGKAVLYGCGDFLNEYEGIGGYEGFRDDLGLMYFLTADALTGELTATEMIPTQIKRLRVN